MVVWEGKDMSYYQSNENNVDIMNSPWWKAPVESGDYTKRRTGALGYTMDDLIGRKDANKYVLMTNTPTTVSGSSGTLLVS